MLIKNATIIWNNLRGIICVYKPPDTKLSHVRTTIINKICSELNEMECRPPIDHVIIEGEIASNDLKVVVQPSLADDPMVVGPRYQAKDLKCSWSNYLGTASSGVLLLGLQCGTSLAKTIRENYPTRAYRIKGSLGQATENFYRDGKVIERSTFKHVKLYNMEKLLANMQAAHQRKMFELCGVDMQSQMAYEIAIQGLIRPSQSKIPLIYGIKCIYFKPPEFIIEILCVNEYEMYLKALINEIGIKLHSTAHCTGIQCIRHSHFSLENALLTRQWTLQNFVKNMEDCSKIFAKYNNILNQENVALRSS